MTGQKGSAIFAYHKHAALGATPTFYRRDRLPVRSHDNEEENPNANT
jgi:hypothetical protein